MNRSLLCFAVLAAAVSARAAAFDSRTLQVLSGINGDASAPAAAPAVSAGKAGTFSVFPKTIDCTGYGRGSLRFYTGLDLLAMSDLPPAGKTPKGVGSRTSHPDETAARLDDYGAVSATQKGFLYKLWSCDTQDYWFTWDTPALMRASAAVKTQRVKGHVHVETRGQVEDEKDLDCTANY